MSCDKSCDEGIYSIYCQIYGGIEKTKCTDCEYYSEEDSNG